MEDLNFANMPLYNEQDFCLINFSHSVTRPGHAYGFAVRSYYLLHYIVRGQGTFTVNQQTYSLKAGQGFLIAPDYQTLYTSDQQNPWEYVWVSFGGKQASNLVESLGLSPENPLFSCTASQGKHLQDIVQAMLANNNFTLSGIYHRLGLLYQFAAVLAAAQKDILPYADDNTYISSMLAYIRDHIDESLTVQGMAAYMNLNRSYLTTLFKKYMHISPLAYIHNCRLTKARHLLESSSLSIAIIANSCGYAKSESLTKAFKKAYGISPLAYRQQYGIRGKVISPVHNDSP